MIIPIIFGVLLTLIIVSVNPVFAEPFDAIKIVEESIIQVDGKTILLTNMYERQFLNSPIIKVHAEAFSGETVLIFFNLFHPDHVKVIIYDGQFKKGKLIKNPITIQESQIETDKPSILEYTPNLDFEYFISSPVSMGEDFTIQVKTIDVNKMSRGTSYDSNNLLEKVKIKVELSQEDTRLVTIDDSTTYEEILAGEWRTKKVMEGTTNKYGKWVGGEPLLSGTFKPERSLQVTITATLDEQVVEKIEQVYLIQQTFGRTSSLR